MRFKEKIMDKKNNILALKDCLAKTIKLNDEVIPGVSVFEHCKIVGLVARELINRQPEWIKDRFFPKGSELVAAVHDVGKVSPYYQEKIHNALKTEEFPKGQKLGLGDPNLDREIGYHSAVSQISIKSKKYISEIIGRHHGSTSNIVSSDKNAEIYGGINWQKNRQKLIDKLKKYFKCDWPIIENNTQADIISGLVSVSDWIGSGEIFDSLITKKTKLTEKLINDAIDLAGFVGFDVKHNLSFENIFSSYRPLEIQTKLFEVVTQPGVYILEAPTGLGKTEAALYAACQCLEKFNATGIYFALPTQLTSDKIYDRFNIFLNNILDENSKFKSLLLHSSAWLRDTELGKEGMPGKEWFSSRKRGLLAPFAVGTVDQALMSVINVKHYFVRTFGLLGKVVILDEIHSYDAYTGTIIDELIRVLQKLGCIVIILSATLSSERRSNLIGEENNENSYPLITALQNKKISYIPISQNESHVVNIQFKNTEEAIHEAIVRANQGQQVLWIENTVGESQDIYNRITTKTDVECGLLHSRFLKIDRSDNEEKWVKIYGKEENLEREKCGHILVGTQVLEQSLDIDADFLVTKICPTDMLIQRLGRLWRHERNRSEVARREAWILAPAFNASKNSKIWDKSGVVYFPYILYRSLEILQGKTKLSLPHDIRLMLEETYKERDESDELNKQKIEIQNERDRLSGLAKVCFSKIGKPISERAFTRHEEIESCEVLLIKKIEHNTDGTLLTLLNNEKLLLLKAFNKEQHKKISIDIQKNVVSVPEYCAPNTLISDVKCWLEKFVYLGKDTIESEFKVAIVKENNVLESIKHQRANQDYLLSYDSILGFCNQKIE
jgi:CRISPR-associated endonuclease/helicase Cas3